ncbi:ATPase inhibitor mai-2, mitochondrial-like [Phlebotomus argentipes]|uniref:ATPase inhibitor mai-2, mitochondrial-like n=1 Tax=Phlebotomus argentipes TaxID=94469 RepID=UPI0028935991|nr:ATPase inhibitor mai-2, mitochondrial-like [Phlebotomus argentipes]
MLKTSKYLCRISPNYLRVAGMSQLGDLGSGAGKGGGGGGSIREAGGSLGKMEAAKEEEYFYRKQREQLQKVKEAQVKEEGHRDGSPGKTSK